MSILHLTTALLGLIVAAVRAVSATDAVQRSSANKVCDTTSKLCYSEYAAPNKVSYRIAIPDTATVTEPFDVVLSIVAPKTVGWAGIAWGGTMANNPLTVGWANFDEVVVSSRRATGHTLPAAYIGATYTVLPSSKVNNTHWQLDVVCSGCSAWQGARGKTVNLDPSSVAVNLAFASSSRAPKNPATSGSHFGYHNARGRWSHDLNSAKLAGFATAVQAAQEPI